MMLLSGLAGDGFAGGKKVVTGDRDAGGHAEFGRFEVSAGIVGFLVTYLTINLEDTIVVFEHVFGDGAGESILGIGVDVHLHDAVAEGLADLFQ